MRILVLRFIVFCLRFGSWLHFGSVLVACLLFVCVSSAGWVNFVFVVVCLLV